MYNKKLMLQVKKKKKSFTTILVCLFSDAESCQIDFDNRYQDVVSN